MLQCPKCGRRYDSDVEVCPEDSTLLQADSTVAEEIPVDPLVGRTFDEKYRLDARLGEGGMGTVYRATHLLIDRPVAIKVLNERFVTDEAAQERFRREARAAGRLQHTNAVTVTDFGRTQDGLVYIVMELLEGKSLREVLAREAPLDTARAVSLMLQISAAVAAAHEAGIIHRDLKPGNIFVVQRKHAPPIIKVLDFGIAKLATDRDGKEVKNITQTGVMIGTPRYMSPEQCDGAELTPSSDVYSLGVILYEMLAGTTPFSGPTPLAVALKHSSELPRPPREFVSTIPQAVEAVVLRALEKKPEDRPQDAGEFRRELYVMAEKLGLEHSAGFSAPTLETLRDVGTETPSGRLIIDLEKMREKRASTTQAPANAPDTAQEQVVETGGGAPARSAPASPESQAEPQAEPLLAGAASAETTPADAEPAVAVSASFAGGRREAWLKFLRQPVALTVIALTALFIIIGIIALLSTRSSNKTSSTNEPDESVGRYVTPTGEAPKVPQPTREPKTAAEFYERGAYFFSLRDYDAAINDYRRALDMQKDFPSAHNRLGRALMAKGQLVAAAAEFRSAIEQQGGNYPAAQYNLGFALQQQGDFNNALMAYNAAINQRGGTYADAFYQIGIILINLQRNKEAEDALRKAISQNGGRDPEAHLALGAVLASEKDYPNAEAEFRTAIEQRNGDFADAHFSLGYLYERTDRPGEAIKEYETYLEQSPSAYNRREVEQRLKTLKRQVPSRK
ncbi:MAG TPA: serine/threonine-protein kinase [Pyrinomonadaceae bacterium]|jgi:serine/threonine-protein kinase